jgi:hypothetical protein
LRTFTEPDFAAIREVLLAPSPIPWISYPEFILNAVRNALLQPLGYKLQSGGKVAFHVYGDRHWVLANFNSEPVKATLKFSKDSAPEYCRIIGKKGKLHIKNEELLLPLKQREIVWVTSCR